MSPKHCARLRQASHAALVFVLLLSACGKETTAPQLAGPPAAMLVVAGDQQSAEVATQLPTPLVVRVLDAEGRAVTGQVVSFRVTAGGGSVFAGATATNDSGVARERWTLGTSSADSQRVEARAVDSHSGEALTFAVFRATALPGPAAHLAIAAGDNQTGRVGQALPESLAVRVSDRYGNPVPGCGARWWVRVGGGSVSADSTVTGAAGTTTVAWTLGTRLDTVHVARAEVGALTPADFTATPGLPPDAVLAKVAGDAQSDTVAKLLPDSVRVSVKLADGRPVQGVKIRWFVSSGGGAVRDSASTTGPGGEAATRWTLGHTAGPQLIGASVASLTNVLFTATALAGPPASVLLHEGNDQSATVGTPVPVAPSALVRDAYDNPVPAAVANFSVKSGGGAVTGAVDTSGSDGVARVGAWTLGTRAGADSLAVAVAGLPPAFFVARGLAGVPASIHAVAGDTQTQQVAGAVAIRPAVEVRDQYGNAVPAAEVTFSVVSGGGTLTDSVVPTDSLGVAAVGSWSLGIKPGSNALSALLSSLPSVSFAARGDPLSFSSVTAGEVNSCGVTAPGVMYCWGWSIWLGTGAPYPHPQAAEHRFLAGSEAVGTHHACAITTSGGTYCWSLQQVENRGQLGTGPSGADGDVQTSARFVQLSAGYYTTCGLTADGTAYCWGQNSAGQIGDSTTTNRSTPVPVHTTLRFQSVSVGTGHACGIGVDSLMYCWGDNSYGQLGVGDNLVRLVPTPSIPARKYLSVSAGALSTCAVGADSLGYCVGSNAYGMLGSYIGSQGLTAWTNPVDSTLRFRAMAAGHLYFNCGVDAGQTGRCWGYNYDGQLGNGSTAPGPSNIGTVSIAAKVLSISSGQGHSCALTEGGTVFCWGQNANGELGLGVRTANSPVPQLIAGQQ